MAHNITVLNVSYVKLHDIVNGY